MKSQEKEIKDLKHSLLKANQDIERLSRIESDFISTISHELCTPLTAIKESISLVLDGVSGGLNEEQKTFLTIAKNNIDRLARIIADILYFSKLESGGATICKRKMDINAIIKDVCGTAESSVAKKNIGFDLDLSDEVGLSYFDPERIGQALKNLILNAIKFNKENGKIKIFSAKERMDGREILKIGVEDTGIGISKKELPYLFKRFRPLDASLTRSYRGAGLGLIICKGIIELHGGQIWAESRENVGSKFIFTLPINAEVKHE